MPKNMLQCKGFSISVGYVTEKLEQAFKIPINMQQIKQFLISVGYITLNILPLISIQ